jgi:DNA modification methylase
LLADPDAILELPEEPTTKPGDLWLLGPHRLLCGDPTRAEDIAMLMAGERAACLWTDPTYGVDYVGKTANALTIADDDAAGLDGLLRAAFANAAVALLPGAPFYVAHPAGPLSLIFQRAAHEAGWRVRQMLIWVKDSLVLGHADYHFRYEPVLYGYLPGGDGRRGRGGPGWYGDDAPTIRRASRWR